MSDRIFMRGPPTCQCHNGSSDQGKIATALSWVCNLPLYDSWAWSGLESAPQQVGQAHYRSEGDQHDGHGGREPSQAAESRPAVAAVEVVKRLLVAQALLACQLSRSVARCVGQH